MKKVIVFLFLFAMITSMYSQDMLIKKQTTILESGYEIYTLYKYDADWKLDSIIQIGQNGDTGIVQVFENERIKIDDRVNMIIYYTFFSDSASSFNDWNENTNWYFLNENYQVYLQKNYGPTGENWGNISITWEEGNCTYAHYSSGQVESITYYDNYLNPFQNENKFLKRGFLGSKNFMQYGEFISFTHDQTVVSSLNGYPTEVDLISNEEERKIYFDYHNFTGIENWEVDPECPVLEMRYYNLLGQQISKPVKGFYIECRVTEKGLNARKYFIP